MTIGECIRTARIAAGMTQTELAEATDIPYQTIGHWERNSTSPKFDSVEKIATVMPSALAIFSTESNFGLVELRSQCPMV